MISKTHIFFCCTSLRGIAKSNQSKLRGIVVTVFKKELNVLILILYKFVNNKCSITVRDFGHLDLVCHLQG